jgi:hypothetical protein
VRRFGARGGGLCGTYEVGRPGLTPYSEKVGTETENFELMKSGEGDDEFIE